MARYQLQKYSVAWEPMRDGQFEMGNFSDDADGTRAPRVLMVGYDEGVTGALRSALGEGCAISQASSAQEAVEELGQHEADVLLIDYHAGSGAVSQFAERAGSAGIPVLWMHADPVEIHALGEIVKALAKRTRRS